MKSNIYLKMALALTFVVALSSCKKEKKEVIYQGKMQVFDSFDFKDKSGALVTLNEGNNESSLITTPEGTVILVYGSQRVEFKPTGGTVPDGEGEIRFNPSDIGQTFAVVGLKKETVKSEEEIKNYHDCRLTENETSEYQCKTDFYSGKKTCGDVKTVEIRNGKCWESHTYDSVKTTLQFSIVRDGAKKIAEFEGEAESIKNEYKRYDHN